MCRMCSYYTKLDLERLPLSNPFLDDMTPSPVEIQMPSNIVVESPESNRHTAWTNVRRFPSLQRPGTVPREAQPSSQHSPRFISIYGPREMSKQSQYTYVPFSPSRDHAGPEADANTFTPRKLQHHNRIDSFPQALADESTPGRSSPSSTPRSLSPVSDEDEFSYLPSTPRVAKAYATRVIILGQPVISQIQRPRPAKTPHQETATTQWMNEACRNL